MIILNIESILENLKIKYEEVEHNPVVSAEDAQYIKTLIKGVGVKNLFLTDKKNYYLVLLEDNKKADLKKLKEFLHCGHLSFATEEELARIMNLKVGSVTPLGIINDKDNLVSIIIDKNIIDKTILVHPSVNTRTISIKYDDLIKYINYFKHQYLIF